VEDHFAGFEDGERNGGDDGDNDGGFGSKYYYGPPQEEERHYYEDGQEHHQRYGEDGAPLYYYTYVEVPVEGDNEHNNHYYYYEDAPVDENNEGEPEHFYRENGEVPHWGYQDDEELPRAGAGDGDGDGNGNGNGPEVDGEEKDFGGFLDADVILEKEEGVYGYWSWLENIERLPRWKRFFIFIWKFTFHVPPPQGNGHSGENSERFHEAEKSYERHREPPISNPEIDRLNEEIRTRRNELDKLRKIVKLDDNLDPALIGLFGQEFKLDEHTLLPLEEIKKNWDSYGSFRSVEDGKMKFAGGAYCWQIQGSKETVLELRCSNESRLVKVVENGTCRFTGVFATPAVCHEDDIRRLERMGLKDLKRLAEEIGVVVSAE
jgi:hypothetical protein